IPSVISEIEGILGSLSQSPDGSVSGVGAYVRFFDQLNLRINLAQGSLSGYYKQDIALVFLAESIALANQTKNQYESVISVGKLLANLNQDSLNFTLLSGQSSNFTIGDDIYLLDNLTNRVQREIIDIQGDIITLDSSTGINL